MRRKAQTWSFDLIIAVIVFIVVVGVFYAILNRSNEGVVDTEVLEGEAKSISFQLNCDVSPVHPPCFIEKGEINISKLEYVAGLSYSELQRYLGTKQDFCIYLVDDENRIVPNAITNAGIGHNDYKLNATIGCDGT